MGHSRASCVCGRRNAELNCRIREERNQQTLIKFMSRIGPQVVKQADAACAVRPVCVKKLTLLGIIGDRSPCDGRLACIRNGGHVGRVCPKSGSRNEGGVADIRCLNKLLRNQTAVTAGSIVPKLDNAARSSRRHPRHRRARQPLAVDGLGVTLDLLQRCVSGDGGDLVHRASGFGESSRRRLARGFRFPHLLCSCSLSRQSLKPSGP